MTAMSGCMSNLGTAITTQPSSHRH